ncbi:MAG: polysaccharide biosynthesis C-terminal domain-containing protein, partial [Solirubrobacteraceae bacterium]
RLGWITVLDLLRQVLSVAGIVILVFAGASLLPFLAVSVPVSVVLLVVTLVLVRGNVTLRPSFDLAEWTLLMRSVLPFAAAVVVGTLYLRVTVVLTSLLATQKQNGYYAISFTVISVLVAIPALTVGSTLPVLARAARDDQDRLGYVLGRLVDVTMIVGVGLALGLALGAGFVTHVLTHGKPGSATTVLQIQSVAVVTQFVGSSWQYALLSIRRHRALLLISASGLVVSVCATLILVPPLQARGAAIAFACGEGTVAVLSFIALRVARPDIRFSLRVPARVVLAAVVGGTAALIPGLASLPVSLVGGALFCAVLLASRAVPPELMHAARNRPKPLAR